MAHDAEEQGTVRYVRCAACGNMNPAAQPTCTRCGKPLPGVAAPPSAARPGSGSTAALVTCPKCQKQFPAGSKFCGFCGTPLPAVRPVAPAKPATMPVAPPRTPAAAPQSYVPSPRVPSKAVPAPPSRPPASPKPLHVPQTRPPAPAAVPPRTAMPTPQVPAAGSPEGTIVFSGLRVPKVEAHVIEKRPDGTAGKSMLVPKEISIGREECDFSYPEDPIMSGHHASVSIRDGKVYLSDLNSQNGLFLKQRQDTELTPGDVFLLGRELFRFATQSLEGAEVQGSPEGTMVMGGAPKLQRGPITAKLEHIQLNGEIIEEFRLEKPETTLGRTTGDLTFNDPYMSGTHARILTQPGRFLLQDLRSRNGIYRRIRNEVELQDGDAFFLGEQMFSVEVKTIS